MINDDGVKRQENIVEFPKSDVTSDEGERARRLKVEVERLASLPPVEWLLYVNEGIGKKYGVSPATMQKMIERVIKERKKKAREDKAEKQQREQRAKKARSEAQREQERREREQQREQERADKEAERQRKKRDAAFEKLGKLPSAQHEARLVELARQLGQDLELLRDEFSAYLGTIEKADTEVEPWPEPVDTKALLTELMEIVRRYVVVHDDGAMAITLWVAFAWAHHVAVHSPILEVTSPEPDCGKTTACGVLKLLTPRAYAAAELSGPSLYRFVDHVCPTLIVDDADRLYQRKPELAHIVNVSWTRGTKIPRQDHGVTRWFDPFCPKVIAGVGLRLDKTTATRTITVKLWPKLPSEKVADFGYCDDEEFLTLRRKLLRWSADNAEAVKDARPVMPEGFNNRLRLNWKLLLAIADLAGGPWPQRARTAALKLARKRHQPSEGRRLLAAFDVIFSTCKQVTSDDVRRLIADPEAEWCDFRNRGSITKRQIALLLDQYDIHPEVIHVGRDAKRGYKIEWFADAFARFLPTIRSSVRNSREKPREKRRK
jgi:hypothetical protein